VPSRPAATLFLLSVLLVSPGLAWCQTAKPARGKPSELQVAVWASSCMSCHGTDGKAEGTGLRLQGLGTEQIYRHLLAFKQGERASTIMHQHAKGYSDSELQLIAQQFGK
jgi:cytochrome c553